MRTVVEGRGVQLEGTARTPNPDTPLTTHGVDEFALATRPRFFSAEDVLEHLGVKRQVGHQLAQLGVLVLELLQPPHLGRRQPVVLPIPVEVGQPR